jgi:sRNA-binding protein
MQYVNDSKPHWGMPGILRKEESELSTESPSTTITRRRREARQRTRKREARHREKTKATSRQREARHSEKTNNKSAPASMAQTESEPTLKPENIFITLQMGHVVPTSYFAEKSEPTLI